MFRNTVKELVKYLIKCNDQITWKKATYSDFTYETEIDDLYIRFWLSPSDLYCAVNGFEYLITVQDTKKGYDVVYSNNNISELVKLGDLIVGKELIPNSLKSFSNTVKNVVKKDNVRTIKFMGYRVDIYKEEL